MCLSGCKGGLLANVLLFGLGLARPHVAGVQEVLAAEPAARGRRKSAWTGTGAARVRPADWLAARRCNCAGPRSVRPRSRSLRKSRNVRAYADLTCLAEGIAIYGLVMSILLPRQDLTRCMRHRPPARQCPTGVMGSAGLPAASDDRAEVYADADPATVEAVLEQPVSAATKRWCCGNPPGPQRRYWLTACARRRRSRHPELPPVACAAGLRTCGGRGGAGQCWARR